MSDGKGLWKRIERLSTRLEHLDFLWGKMGATFLGKVIPVIVAGIAALLAWFNKQPLYVLFLAALAAGAMALAIIWLVLSIQDKRLTTLNIEVSKKPVNKAAQSGSSHWLLPAAIIIAAIIVVGGLWALFNWPNQLQYDRTKLIFASASRPPVPERSQYLGFNIAWTNSGPLTISYVRHFYKFKETSDDLTPKQIEEEFEDITQRLPPKDLFSDELPPGIGGFSTMEDQRFNGADWNEVLAGRKLIFFFAVFKYDVESQSKIGEICLVYARDYPSVHTCSGNNKTYYDK